MQRKVNSPKSKAGNKPLAKRKNNNRNSIVNLSIPRGVESYAPNSYQCTLKYTDQNIVKNSAGNQFIYWRLRMNDLFDPDPLILSGSISGFAEMNALFRRYLVTHFTVTTTIANNETFPVTIITAPSDLDFATIITTAASAQNMGEIPLAKTYVLAAKGGMDRISFKQEFYLPDLVGQPGAYRDSLTYSALSNASPTTQLFYNWACSSATNFVNGITQQTVYHFYALFTQRNYSLA